MQPTNAASIDRRDLQKLHAARDTMTKLVLANPVYVPIFQRIEKEIELAEAASTGDSLAQARAIACQIATRWISSCR